MQQTTEVSSSEWRWVIIFSGLLVTLTLLPYVWAFASDTPNDHWQFMGILSNPLDGATYFAKIGEGVRGQWLFTLAHTPEVSDGVAIHEFYLLLGHLADVLNFTPPLIFHLARIATGFAMYIAFYFLGATIWQRLRARRLFFGLIAVGSGLGWLATLFFPTLHPIDLYVPEAIPLYATFINPHFPLSIALVTLIAATFIRVFRPGYNVKPSLGNGGLTLGIVAFVLALLQPQAWLPIGFALSMYLVVQTIQTRKLPPEYQSQWVALAVIPALPVLAYDLGFVYLDPLYRNWNAQNVTSSGSVFNYILGFGLLLLVALPGLWRALRHFEQDGDRLMFVWLITNALLLYAPFNLQRRLVIGMIIPIVYFAVRSLEDFWFNRIRPKWREAALVTLFVFVIPSNVFALLIPLVGITQPTSGLRNYQLLPADYNHALSWLHDNTAVGSVILAPPTTSLWIPAYSPARVVYGHPFETVDALTKRAEVADWYAGKHCAELIGQYHIQFVIMGPSEYVPSRDSKPPALNVDTTSNESPCVRSLGKPVAHFGTVTIYAATPTFSIGQ